MFLLKKVHILMFCGLQMLLISHDFVAAMNGLRSGDLLRDVSVLLRDGEGLLATLSQDVWGWGAALLALVLS